MKGEAGGSPFHAAASRAACPHCGYDLSGTVNSWKESCPLEGVCSECGAAVEWSRVFAAAGAPAWSCEHAPRFSVWKLCRTAWKLLRPRAYWRAFTPEMPVRAVRLAWMVVGFALLSYVAMVAFYLAVTLGVRLIGAGIGAYPFSWPEVLEQWQYFAASSPALMEFGGRSGDLNEGWDILIALAVVLVALFAVDATASRFSSKRPTHGHGWRAATMLLLGLTALHAARFFLVIMGAVVGECISPGFGMGYGMLVGPMICSSKAAACLIILYGVTMWTACLLEFYKIERGRLAVIIAWLLIFLGVLWYWLVPFVMWWFAR